MKLWLRNHGFPSNGNKDQLRKAMEEAILENGGQPPPRVKPAGGPVSTVLRCNVALVRMVSVLMQKTTNREHRSMLDRAIKLYLSEVSDMDGTHKAVSGCSTHQQPHFLTKSPTDN